MPAGKAAQSDTRRPLVERIKSLRRDQPGPRDFTARLSAETLRDLQEIARLYHAGKLDVTKHRIAREIKDELGVAELTVVRWLDAQKPQ